MMAASTTHLVLIPSYNTGRTLLQTVRSARAQWSPVWVVIDGSTDGSAAGVRELAASDAGLKLIELAVNSGKGAAVLHGLQAARDAGFTHALTMDADGQHPAGLIPAFMQASVAHPDSMVLGRPVFDASAPLLRVRGRKVSNWWTNLETLGAGIDDSLYGFRVYPVVELIAVMRGQPWMRRFDFDTEAVVRLAWRGVAPINLAAPVKYLSADEGGVSHFRYGRDNVLLTWMHLRLMLEFVLRLPGLLWRRVTRRPPFQHR
ncbi:MAG: glycosyltransferase family 2 protein [Telluria sp.]|nr:glycosyltransferase family 2 protein [Telluria sp.]